MSERPPAGAGRWWEPLVVALAVAALFAVALGDRDLWNPNEPIYGEAVREMYAAGDWSVPRVNGELFPEKPILYFWLGAAASSLLGGVSETALRLPSVAAAAAACVALYLLVYPYAGRGRARIAVAVLATTYGFWWAARTVQMDILLTATTLGSVLSATRGLDHGLRGSLAATGVGLCCGLGFLAKGPVGVICPVLVLGVYGLGSRAAFRTLLRWSPGVFAVAVLVAAPWFVWLGLRGEPGALHEMLYRQNVVRFLEPWDHRQPWWYFGVNFWVDGLPWALLIPWAVALPGRRDGERRLDRLALGWIVALIVFFSLSASKRSAYLLPAAPAVAILVAGLVRRGTIDGKARWRSIGLAATRLALAGGVVLAGGYVAWKAAGRYPELAGPARILGVWMVAGGLAWVAVCFVSRLRRRWFAVATAVLAGIYVIGAVAVLPAADRYKSARGFGEEIRSRVPPTAPLHAYKTWRWRSSYIYYAGRTMPRITDRDALRVYWQRPERVWLLVERGMWEEVEAVLGPLQPEVSADIGHNRAYLVSNRPAG